MQKLETKIRKGFSGLFLFLRVVTANIQVILLSSTSPWDVADLQ
jgi:hypothetical protein